MCGVEEALREGLVTSSLAAIGYSLSALPS